MKRPIAMTNVTKWYRHVFRCGYCDVQRIFRGVQPAYYNSGVYGWNCDIYVDSEYDVAITTGYRNMRGDRIPRDLIEKYEAQAEEILESLWVEDVQDRLDANRKAFIRELLGKEQEQ